MINDYGWFLLHDSKLKLSYVIFVDLGMAINMLNMEWYDMPLAHIYN